MPDAQASPTASDVRAFVQAASRIWIRRLIDYSRFNSLLFYRDLKAGTFDLTPYEGAVEILLTQDTLTADQLVKIRVKADKDLRQSIQKNFVSLRRKALSNAEEKGIQTLHLALGLATWPAGDGGRPYNAPILLIPALIDSRGRSGGELRLSVAGEPRLNPVLLSVLEDTHSLRINAAAVLNDCKLDGGDQPRVDSARVFAAIKAEASRIDEFEVRNRHIVANFQFAKMAMVQDLRNNQEAMAASSLVAAVAGHPESRQQLAQADVNVEPRDLDDIPSRNEFLVLDADSTQQRAIVAVSKGLNCVIQGPPGTGKSQTIANLIAQSVADGKRILFVAEKRAALDAVVRRLTDPNVGLGHLILDLHGASVSRKEVMAQLGNTLESIPRCFPPQGAEHVYQEYESLRTKLNAYARAVNAPRPPSGLSLNQVIGRLLRLPPGSATGFRIRDDALGRLTTERLQEMSQMLRECGADRAILFSEGTSPWAKATLSDGHKAQQAADLVKKLAREILPQTDALLVDWTNRTGVKKPRAIRGVFGLLQMIKRTNEFLNRFESSIFDSAPTQLALMLSPAKNGFLASLWAALTNRSYRSARKQVRRLARTALPDSGLQAGAEQAAEIAAMWSRVRATNGIPDTGVATKLCASLQQLSSCMKELQNTSGLVSPETTTLAELRNWLEALAADHRTPYRMPALQSVRRRLDQEGLAPLIDELRDHNVPDGIWEKRLEYAWLYSMLESILVCEPILANFRGRSHEDLIKEFKRLDKDRIALAATRVRRRHAERACDAMNTHYEQANLVRTEAKKQTRHIPLRDLLSRAPDVLTRLAPCWIASPLSVSHLLDGSKQHFDILIFDEASQILQEEAVPALWRARQVVVAGDRHQLPPSTFFATAVVGEDITEEEVTAEEQKNAMAAQATAGTISGFESLLATLESFLPNSLLEWHYRSKDERLIAFSNEHIYLRQLITFPTALHDDAICHVLVPHVPAAGGQEESASREVEKVVQLVIEHAVNRPNESLGVITLGIKHANRIQAAIDLSLESRPDLADFFALEKKDRFFIKNLETVQGDERDAIILTVGYGKSANGDLPHRFGPLTHQAGHRRLNVAVTRAKRRMTVVSSFSHHDIDLSRSGSKGVQLLKAYLEFTASGGAQLLPAEVAGEVGLNPFEADIRDAIEAKGIRTRPQFGASRYRIDLVAMHPKKPGRPVLAIECDGATYHSSPTARDRDRLRQSHLQKMGWRFHRIWSTDWFYGRESEIERLFAAYEDAVRRADEADARGEVSKSDESQGDANHHRDTLFTLQPERGPKPAIPEKDSIDRYTDRELRLLAEWVASDRLLRTNEQIVREMFAHLPFRNLGSRIRDRLESIARRMSDMQRG